MIYSYQEIEHRLLRAQRGIICRYRWLRRRGRRGYTADDPVFNSLSKQCCRYTRMLGLYQKETYKRKGG